MSFYQKYAWVYDQSSVWVDRYEEPLLIKYEMDTEYVSNVYKHVMDHSAEIVYGYFGSVDPEIPLVKEYQAWLVDTKLCRALAERLESDGASIPEYHTPEGQQLNTFHWNATTAFDIDQVQGNFHTHTVNVFPTATQPMTAATFTQENSNQLLYYGQNDPPTDDGPDDEIIFDDLVN